jgi:hypothetical protein
VTVVQTVLVFVVIPLAIYGVIALLTLWPKFTKSNRYRPGQEWNFEPVWWTGNPVGVGSGTTESHTPNGTAASTDSARAPERTARGGASGRW